MLGKSYCLAFAICTIAAPIAAECPSKIPASEIEVFPSAASVPENLIRFYLYFPRPMHREISPSDIRLIDSSGQDVPQAFLPMRFELWTSDRRRLTLILDPGRVKTGLESHSTLGRALRAGDDVELKLMSSLKDSNGCGLEADASFDFTVRSADRDPLAPDTWSIEVPKAGTQAALKIDLGRPHDHLSMAYRIRVQSLDGLAVAGSIELEANERVWSFVPRDSWTPKPHKIVIDDRMEDLAGNRPGIAFDRPPGAPARDWVREITFTPQH